MNLLAMSEREMVNYLDLCSDDPVIKRLLSMISFTQEEYEDLVDNLVDAGMDREYLVFNGMTSPGSYIRDLENQVEDLERENSDLSEELDSLKTKTVVELIHELKEDRLRMEHYVRESQSDNEFLRKRTEQLEEKLNMWTIMNKV